MRLCLLITVPVTNMSLRINSQSRRPLRAARVAVVHLIVLSFVGTAIAQVETRPEDVATIDGIMKAYYEVVSGPAGEFPDQARDSTLHHPQAWIAIADVSEDDKPVVRILTLNDFYASDEPRAEGFFEWETAREVRRSGNMIHVWSSYATAKTPGGEPFDTGVNSITLFDDGQRLWVMNWMFDGSAD